MISPIGEIAYFHVFLNIAMIRTSEDDGMKKELIRNYLIMMLGGMVVGAGVAFVVFGNLGGDAMTTFQQGLSVFFQLDLSIAQIIANAIFVIILFVFFRDHVNLDTILCPLFITLGCKIATTFVPQVDAGNMVFRVIYMLIGVAVIGAGIGIGAQTPSGSNPYDGFVLCLSKKLNKNFGVVRPVCDALLLIVGILIHGSWGIGTIVATLFQGYVGNFFIKLFQPIFSK